MRDRVTLVWLALMVITCVTWWLGADHPFRAESIRLASALALGLAFVKARFVGLDFMELRRAPVHLRMAFEMWVAAFGISTVMVFLV